MGYNFPASPQVDDVYTTPTGAEYTWNGEAWDLGGAQAAPNEFVRIIGDTMTGKLVLPDPDPTAPLDASHKKYVDRIVAEQTLWQGVWSVAANDPDMHIPPNDPLAGYSWTCQTANPNIPEVAPATLPGIGGLTIASGDTIKFNDVTAVYDLIRAAQGISRMLISDAPPAVALHGQQFWDSDSGKMYVRYEDPSGNTFWVQVSGGGGGSRYIVPVSDIAPTSAEQGQLWFNSTDASLYIYFDDGTSAAWVDVSGGVP